MRGDSYSIPPDNPFALGGGKPEVWALGLRNPWRFSFDRATRDLWIGDVGQSTSEEVDLQPANATGGLNYGWNIWEGTHRYNPSATVTEATFPVVAYATQGEGHCAITGGYVYRGAHVPSLVGTYVYGDFCSGQIWGLRAENGIWVSRELKKASASIASFAEGPAGELYVVNLKGEIDEVV